jgi:hypothetical protein
MPKLVARNMTLAEAAAVLPAVGGRDGFSGATIRQWSVQGYRVAASRVVRLETRRKGGRWRIRPEALDRFLRELRAAGVVVGRRPSR